MNPSLLTLKAAKQAVKALGYSLKRTVAGDFKLSTIGDTNPNHGYFTADLQDAVDTAKAMKARAL